MQNRTNSGFTRPQLWPRPGTSDARPASRSRAVFALPTPVTTPTSRKIHHRRMSQPPIPASTPPMMKRMIAPTKDSKKAVTEKEELVAAPIVPVRKLRNPYRIITIPTMRKAAPTRRTVTAPQPNGRLGAALWTGAGAYGEGAAMGSAVLGIAVGFGTASISPRINVSMAFPAVVLTSVGSGKSRFALFLVSRAVEQCLKSHRRQSEIDGLPIEARSSPHPRRRLRTREAGRRNGPWPHPCRPDARPRGSRQPPAGISRRLLPGRDERDRDEQSPPAPNPGDGYRAVQALRLRGAEMAVAAWRKGVAEFIGAYTLIFIGAGAVLTAGSTSTSDLLLIALAHGLAIGVMVSALAHVSGGHFNPAVTFGALVSRQISPRLAVVYLVAPLFGGVGGALTLAAVFPADILQLYHLGTPTLWTSASLRWDVGIRTGILVEA